MSTMTLTHYLAIAEQLVRKQMMLTKTNGFVVSWDGTHVEKFQGEEWYKTRIKNEIRKWIDDGELDQDVDDLERRLDEFFKRCELQ